MHWPQQPAGLFEPLMGDARAADILSPAGYVARMLRFEAALARAEARVGVIPLSAAAAIDHAVSGVLREDGSGVLDEMARQIADATATVGTPVVPLVKLLSARTDEVGRAFVHWGATTQDVMDTAMVLQLRDWLSLVSERLAELAADLARLARTHRRTPMIGRTVMQHALPITFGLKCAAWLDAVARHRQRLGDVAERCLVVQFGGAVGTLASLGSHGPQVVALLAEELDLAAPALPWHGARDRIGEVAMFAGLICGTLAKLGRDITLLMQTEVGEAHEPAAPGRGGSSTMPHKRNPVLAAVLTGAGTVAPGLVAALLSAQAHEHERAAGLGHVEWRVLPDLLALTAGALRAATELAGGLTINPERMLANLSVTGGLVMAEAVMMRLGVHVGRLEAHHLVQEACRTAIASARPLADVLADDARVTAHLSPATLQTVMDPLAYLGATDAFIDAALAVHEAMS
jgi:3-carboxy-cis,cis-muconate cycloisomerase